MPDDMDIVTVAFYSVFSVLVLVSNSIVIIVIMKSRQLHVPTLWNITVMAAWDFALGLHWLVFVVPSKILNAFVYPERYGIMATQVLQFICIQNILNIVVALVDRYISVCWPLHYIRLMSAKRFAIGVMSAFLINIFQLCILLSTNNGYHDGVYNKALGIFKPLNTNMRMALPGGFAVMACFITAVLLIRIRIELGRKRTNTNNGRHQNNSTQFTYTIYVSTLTYIVCYIPVSVLVLFSFITEKENVVLLQVGVICMLSNSLWNVFIYAATYRPFRDAFLKLFCPLYFRDRARREFQTKFRRNEIGVFTIE